MISQFTTYTWISQFSLQVVWVVQISEIVGPGPNCSDVKAEVFLVWGRADGEGVVLILPQLKTCNSNPLSRFIVKCCWSLEN